MNSFTLSAYAASNIAVALACCMSTEETRYYLNGICLENDKDYGLMALATDGHRLGKLKIKLDELLPKNFKVIIPIDAVTWLGKIGKKESAPVEFVIDDTTITFKCGGQSASFELIDGNFPDWQRTLPNDPKPVAAFNAIYLAEIAEAARKSGTTNIVKLHMVDGLEASAPTLIKTGNEALEYVLMPTRF